MLLWDYLPNLLYVNHFACEMSISGENAQEPWSFVAAYSSNARTSALVMRNR